MTSQEALFWNNFNLSFAYLEPWQRKELNLVLRACEDSGVDFRYAIRVAFENPKSLPIPVYVAIKKADDLGIFEFISSLFQNPSS